MYPTLEIALELGSQFNVNNKDGRRVLDNSQAQKIPKLITIPYPIICGIGEYIIDKNANIVVIDVRNMGKPNDSIVFFIALFLLEDFLNSLKKRVTT
tara:strand:+ start:145 stop:435 length:291 start_codon:yes stop_codon:yes gene_type:complete